MRKVVRRTHSKSFYRAGGRGLISNKASIYNKFLKEKKGFLDSYRNGDDGAFLSIDEKYFIFPGFCDLHVHFREPGFFIKKR